MLTYSPVVNVEFPVVREIPFVWIVFTLNGTLIEVLVEEVPAVNVK
jgi:hypothetical protein